MTSRILLSSPPALALFSTRRLEWATGNFCRYHTPSGLSLRDSLCLTMSYCVVFPTLPLIPPISCLHFSPFLDFHLCSRRAHFMINSYPVPPNFHRIFTPSLEDIRAFPPRLSFMLPSEVNISWSTQRPGEGLAFPELLKVTFERNILVFSCNIAFSLSQYYPTFPVSHPSYCHDTVYL